jgi:hypothetical protein
MVKDSSWIVGKLGSDTEACEGSWLGGDMLSPP